MQARSSGEELGQVVTTEESLLSIAYMPCISSDRPGRPWATSAWLLEFDFACARIFIHIFPLHIHIHINVTYGDITTIIYAHILSLLYIRIPNMI